MRIRFICWAALTGATLCGCFGGGSTPPAQPPSGLFYPLTSARYLVELAIAPNVPTVQGAVTAWTVAPALPPGLTLELASGAITGTPQAPVAAAAFGVTAHGPGGSTTVAVVIGVEAPPRFAYVSHPGDDTVAIYTVDTFSGELRPIGYQELADGGTGIQEVVVHPSAGYAFVPELGTGSGGSISTYAIDPATGRLELRASAPCGEGPHRTALSRDGTRIYVTAFGDDLVRSFDFDESTGALSETGMAPTDDGPVDIVTDPLGRFAFVVNQLSGSISTFEFRPDGSLDSNLPSSPVAQGSPERLAVDPAGENVYVTVKGVDELLPFLIDDVSGALTEMVSEPTGEQPSAVAIHPTGSFAYVPSELGNCVTVFAVDAQGRLSHSGTFEAGDGPRDFVLDASGTYAWSVNLDSNDVTVYTVDPLSGGLTSAGAFRARGAPTGLAFSQAPAPTRLRAKHLYVVGNTSADVTAYAVDAVTGALTQLGPPAPTASSPDDLALDPLGRFAYVPNAGDDSITIFEIDADQGTLAELVSPHALPGRPRAAAVDPSGRFLLVATADTESLHSFAIDPLDGTLSALDVTTTEQEPCDVAIDPTGRFVYVSNCDANSISAYEIADGAFLAGPSNAPAPSEPHEVRFSPTGGRGFSALRTSKLIVPYDIDPHTGVLTVLPNESARTSQHCSAFELHPNGRFGYSALPGLPAQSGLLGHYTVDPETGDVQTVSELSHGIEPWELRVAPNGRLVFVVDRSAHDVVVFSIDPEDGTLSLRSQHSTGSAPDALRFTLAID